MIRHLKYYPNMVDLDFFNQSKIYSVLHIICFAVWDFDSFAIDVIDIDLFVCIRSVFNIYYTNNLVFI